MTDIVETATPEDRGDFLEPPAPPAAQPTVEEDAAAAGVAPAAAEAPAAEAPAEQRPPAHMVPKARLDEVLAKTRELQAQVEVLTRVQQQAQPAAQQQAATQPLDALAALEEQYADALLDGDKRAAVELGRQIRKMEMDIHTQQAAQVVQGVNAQTAAAAQYDAVVDEIEREFPVFNPDSETYNDELAQEALVIANGYASQGMVFHDALAKAVGTVARANGVAPVSQQPSAAQQRQQQSLARNASAASQQPPNLSAAPVGTDSSQMGGPLTAEAVASMTMAQFEKLSQEDLARARGDIL